VVPPTLSRIASGSTLPKAMLIVRSCESVPIDADISTIDLFTPLFCWMTDTTRCFGPSKPNAEWLLFGSREKPESGYPLSPT
jgi:hypothetical protein